MTREFAAECDISPDGVLGIIDYGYAPYSLGDTMTWLTNLQVAAHSHGASSVDIIILTNPARPSFRHQRTITGYNYINALENVFPAFLCSPMLRSIRIYEHADPFARRVLQAALARQTSWPNMIAHFQGELDYSTHDYISRFHRERNYIPLLAAPRGYESATKNFREKFLAGRDPVILNIRRGAFRANPAATQRDSAIDAWDGFLSHAEEAYPSARFVMVGGFSEWERDIVRRKNVVVPRALGYGLGVELGLLLSGIPFIGTSSGFSAAATFSATPYVITSIEAFHAQHSGLPVGTVRYPFAKPNQWMSWDLETEEGLTFLFDRLWRAVAATKAA
jgi:hypothetical protein